MNLKERLRIEVRKELIKLEKSCIDMASLLRSLGIPVGGGFCPLSNEVREIGFCLYPVHISIISRVKSPEGFD